MAMALWFLLRGASFWFFTLPHVLIFSILLAWWSPPLGKWVLTYMPLEHLFVYLVCVIFNIWAAARQNQQRTCALSEDSYQRGHPPSLTRIFMSAWRNLGSLSSYWAHSEASDQTTRTRWLIWVFTERTGHFAGLSCCRSSSSSSRCH